MEQRILLYTGTPRGFTLIELLVVIAIIGILTAVVMASVGSVRSKGHDARIISDLITIRNQAEIYAIGNNFSYGTLTGPNPSNLLAGTSACFTQSGNLFADPSIKNAIMATQQPSGSLIRCYATPTKWAVGVSLKTNPLQAWCVDSNGFSSTTVTSSMLSASGNLCQ